jgi:hypothetical protein
MAYSTYSNYSQLGNILQDITPPVLRVNEAFKGSETEFEKLISSHKIGNVYENDYVI